MGLITIKTKEAFLAALLILVLLITACAKPSSEIRLGNEPFLYDVGSDTGILLIHGFTASPWEVRELGVYLAERNITSYGILLSGHGTDVRNMKKTTWQQWYNDSQNGLDHLKSITKNVYVAGISLGGSLSLALAEDNDVKGVISISSPIYLRNQQAQYANILKYVNDYIPANNLTDEEKFYYYDKRPLESISQLMNFIDYYRKSLNKVTEPVLILQSEEDETIQPYSAAIIYEKISSKDKEIKWFKGTSHVLTKSENKDAIFEDIYDFIKRISSG